MEKLTFPIDKSFYRSDNLFKHDFLLRHPFDDVDLLWYRTHEQVNELTQLFDNKDIHFFSLDEGDLNQITRTVDLCPENMLEIQYLYTLNELTKLQEENEIYDFHYEFYFTSTDDFLIKDDLKLQKKNEIIRALRILETDDITCYYEKFWDYVYEKSALKTIMSPTVCDHGDIQCERKPSSSRRSSESTETSSKNREGFFKQLNPDDVSLMNARFILEQLREKNIEDDRLTYVNVFAEETEEEMEEGLSSSATMSTDVETSMSEGSKLTEISFEKDSSFDSDTSLKDPFSDKSYDTLFYIARRIYDHLSNSSDAYFIEAPTILLENDLVVEMKEKELVHLQTYNKIIDKYMIKTVDMDGNEGYKARMFRKGLLRITDDAIRHMEEIKQKGVVMMNKTKKWEEFNALLLSTPKARLCDLRKLIHFDAPVAEITGNGQKKKIKHYKTDVCVAGRTKLRRYDFCERITNELNSLKLPTQKVAVLTKAAREHATFTLNSYLEILLRLTKKRQFFEDYPDDLFHEIRGSIDKTKRLMLELKTLREVCLTAKLIQEESMIYKPLSDNIRIYGMTPGLNKREIDKIKSDIADESEKRMLTKLCAADNLIKPGFSSGLNLIIKKLEKPFEKTSMPSKLKEEKKEVIDGIKRQYFEVNGLPMEHSNILNRHSKK